MATRKGKSFRHSRNYFSSIDKFIKFGILMIGSDLVILRVILRVTKEPLVYPVVFW